MTDDLISRQAAIEAIDETDWYHQNKNKDMVSGANSAEHQPWFKSDDVYSALKSVPSAPRWIPVSERLPEEEKDVLCFTIHQTMLVASYGKLYPLSDEVGWITNEYNRLHVSSVLAWMPLPEPYKEADK